MDEEEVTTFIYESVLEELEDKCEMMELSVADMVLIDLNLSTSLMTRFFVNLAMTKPDLNLEGSLDSMGIEFFKKVREGVYLELEAIKKGVLDE